MYQNAYMAAASGCAEPDCEKDPLISQEPSIIPIEHDYSGFDIVKATQYGAIARVRELIESGCDVNQPDSETVTLLHWAAINNRRDIIKYFIEKGAIVDAVGGELNATPLHWATRQGHLGAVVLLVSAGADPSLRDAEGCSCIHLAAQFGHTALVGYFIARGINPDLQDRGGMTALMWSAWKVSAVDPVRLLLTLGANPSLADNTHGNTALHWAILARNTTTISTLLFKGKASLDIPNLRGQTPFDMLHPHMGSVWVSKKIRDKLRNCSQYHMKNQSNRPWLRFLYKFSLDKRIRWWSMVATPFLTIYIAGMIFSADAIAIVKLGLLVGLYLCLHLAGKFMFDDQLLTVLPLSIYMATKFWFYVIWFAYIATAVSFLESIIFFGSSLLLWFFFLRATRNPGIIESTQEQRLRTIVELSEKGASGFDPSLFCSACLVRRPLRSKHCSTCDRCIALFDHHCPWLNNCVGYRTHLYFMGFLYMLLVMCMMMVYGSVQFYSTTCHVKVQDGFYNAIIKVGKCNAWVTFMMANVLLHISWVAILTFCQTYQIVWLGMTTNERMNRGRYRHFQANGGKSPFDRGPIGNLVDFLDCNCFGLFSPMKRDWMNYFDLESDKGIEHEPLLRATDNYQYV